MFPAPGLQTALYWSFNTVPNELKVYVMKLLCCYWTLSKLLTLSHHKIHKILWLSFETISLCICKRRGLSVSVIILNYIVSSKASNC